MTLIAVNELNDFCLEMRLSDKNQPSLNTCVAFIQCFKQKPMKYLSVQYKVTMIILLCIYFKIIRW